jgi:hypothetical protein
MKIIRQKNFIKCEIRKRNTVWIKNFKTVIYSHYSLFMTERFLSPCNFQLLYLKKGYKIFDERSKGKKREYYIGPEIEIFYDHDKFSHFDYTLRDISRFHHRNEFA